MVVVDLSLIGNLEEKIDSVTFRNKGAFKIAKSLREKSFTMAIDVIIESIDFNLYESSKSTPVTQFYGYCVLVFQDMTSLEIPIHFPRQRLYYAVQNEAFRQWRGYSDFYQEYFLHRQHDISIGLILAALEIPPIEIDYEINKTKWIELPLREVYIKCKANTQFKVEFTRWQPVPFTDPLTGGENDGTSGQEDGEKDDGLPKDGIEPKRNSPDNPFSGNKPISSIQEAGQNGLPLIDSSDINNPDSDNAMPQLAWLEFRAPRKAASFNPPCSTKYSLIIIPIPSIDTRYSVSFEVKGTDSCDNNDYGIYTVTDDSDGSVLGTAGYLDAFGGVVIYNSGNSYPENVYYSLTPV